MLIRESIKDAHKYVPDFLDQTLERNLQCLKNITTPNGSLPLFNGSVETNLSNFYDYLNHFKIKIKKIKYHSGNIHVLRNKKDIIFLKQEAHQKRTFLIAINLATASFEYYTDNKK